MWRDWHSKALLLAAILVAASMMPLTSKAAGTGAEYLQAGTKAVKDGKYQEAVRLLTRAIKSKSISNEQIAQALYQRGIAYQKDKKPAFAIADLTSALYIKSLPAADRANAYKSRAKAYGALGQKARAVVDNKKAGSPAAATQAASNDNDRSSGFTAKVSRTSKTKASAPSKPVKTSNRPAQTTQVNQGRWQTTATASSSGNEQSTEKSSGEGGGTFLSRLFSSQQEETKPQPKVRPKRTQTSAPVQNWGKTTQVKVASRRANGQPAQAATGYRLQLASVRGQDQAKQAWRQLKSRHGDLLAGRDPEFQKLDLGEKGTYYRIQIGPFADKSETLELCNSFKKKGLDCFLVAR